MSRRLRAFWLVLALPLVAAVGACTEDLQTGRSCPLLCPGQGIEVKDTILDNIVVLDSSLVGFPFQGSEEPLLMARLGDSLDVRPVVRFDTLTRTFLRSGVATPETITDLDSAFVNVFLTASTVPTPAQWFIDIYNVWDSTLVDTVRGQLIPLFTPANRIGTYQGDTAFTDTLRIKIPIDTAYLRALLGTFDQRLRIGFQVRAAAPVMFLMNSFEAGNGATLQYKIITSDSTVTPLRTSQPTSMTPVAPLQFAGDLLDFQIVVAAPNHALANTFYAGGLPGSRAYLRFALPAWVTDSVGLLRAELLLSQSPISGPASNDSLLVDAHLIVANATIPNLFRAATLLSPAGIFAPSFRVLPSEARTIRLNINTLVRQWNTNNTARALPTAILLRVNREGGTPAAARFFSNESPNPALRPRLRLSYTPTTILGRP